MSVTRRGQDQRTEAPPTTTQDITTSVETPPCTATSTQRSDPITAEITTATTLHQEILPYPQVHGSNP